MPEPVVLRGVCSQCGLGHHDKCLPTQVAYSGVATVERKLVCTCGEKGHRA